MRYIIVIVIALFLASPIKAQESAKADITYINDTTLNFHRLIEKFKGKVIYVDIWATWCSPCRQELRSKKDMGAFYKFAAQNDVVVLYICCDDDGKSWKQFIKANKLSGYHILENTYLHGDFQTTFSSVQKRNGKLKRSFYIPRHIIVDKNGHVADSTASKQGGAAAYATINKLLGKSVQ